MHNATLRGGYNAKHCNATCRPRWITLSNKLALSLAVYIYKYIYLLLLYNLYIQKLKYKVKLIIKLVTISPSHKSENQGNCFGLMQEEHHSLTHKHTQTRRPTASHTLSAFMLVKILSILSVL